MHAELGHPHRELEPAGQAAELFTEPTVTPIAEAHGVTPAQAILRWHVQLGAVPIPKSADPERQRANLDVFGFALSDDGDGRDHRAGARPDLGATRTPTRSSSGTASPARSRRRRELVLDVDLGGAVRELDPRPVGETLVHGDGPGAVVMPALSDCANQRTVPVDGPSAAAESHPSPRWPTSRRPGRSGAAAGALDPVVLRHVLSSSRGRCEGGGPYGVAAQGVVGVGGTAVVGAEATPQPVMGDVVGEDLEADGAVHPPIPRAAAVVGAVLESGPGELGRADALCAVDRPRGLVAEGGAPCVTSAPLT